jgi:hypothetical protein
MATPKPLSGRPKPCTPVHDEIGDAVGQAISLSTKNQTYYIFPKNRPLEIVKLRLACEEMHKFVMGENALGMETIEIG